MTEACNMQGLAMAMPEYGLIGVYCLVHFIIETILDSAPFNKRKQVVY
jgi:hypothetical protein